MNPIRRVAQFFQALGAALSEDDEALTASHLSEAELALFRGMPAQDRRHGVRVLRILLQEEESDSDLFKAALVHDAGKTDPCSQVKVPLLCRVFVVLAEAFYPPLIAMLAKKGGGTWRHAFYLHRNHAELGAALAEGAGSSETVVRLIRYHHARWEDPLARRLRAADEQS